jgi:nitroimidazol reductase NimA-like FMN-containing flavoprotein (pyridoxamine 5'-phosphate oxidase superfamily)
MAKYPVLVDGEAITIKPGEILRFACCDCGLVHNMAFAFEDGEIGIAIERNKRATGQKRRHMKGRGGEPCPQP